MDWFNSAGMMVSAWSTMFPDVSAVNASDDLSKEMPSARPFGSKVAKRLLEEIGIIKLEKILQAENIV